LVIDYGFCGKLTGKAFLMFEHTRRGGFLGLLLLAPLLLVPLPLAAQDQTNCNAPQTQTDMNICAARAFEAADTNLNAAYKTAMAEMKATDANLPPELKGAEKALRAGQRAWITYRDKACEAYGFLARGGSMESMLVGSCLADVTRTRTKELEDLGSGLGN
jgi:uncharacterized protein YecT (DUF1311 family)